MTGLMSWDVIVTYLYAVGAGLVASYPFWNVAIVAVGVFVAVTLLAIWAMPAHSNRTVSRSALAILSVALGCAGPRAFGDSEPWQPFFAQTPGELPLLLARAGLLLALVVATEEQAPRVRVIELSLAGALLIATLCFQILLLPYCCATIFAIGVVTRRMKTKSGQPQSGFAWITLILVLAMALVPNAARASTQEPLDPQAAISFWLRRDNPYRAHYRALQWAKRETIPDEGYLALAKVDIALMRAEKARKVLAKVVAHTQSTEIRRRAQTLLFTLDHPARTETAP